MEDTQAIVRYGRNVTKMDAFGCTSRGQAHRAGLTLPSSGTMLISLVDGSGNPVSVEVQSVTDGVKVKVSRVPDGVAGYSVWGLKLPTLRQRLFRCVSIRENDDASPPCSMYRKKKPSWITGRTLTAT
ncbi:hypothetical protein [Escherichia coli]|uniref:hypothetical protein n=1 Tax=Escherichia coli TaxID=562 RepID=UPI003D66D44A